MLRTQRRAAYRKKNYEFEICNAKTKMSTTSRLGNDDPVHSPKGGMHDEKSRSGSSSSHGHRPSYRQQASRWTVPNTGLS